MHAYLYIYTCVYVYDMFIKAYFLCSTKLPVSMTIRKLRYFKFISDKNENSFSIFVDCNSCCCEINISAYYSKTWLHKGCS